MKKKPGTGFYKGKDVVNIKVIANVTERQLKFSWGNPSRPQSRIASDERECKFESILEIPVCDGMEDIHHNWVKINMVNEGMPIWVWLDKKGVLHLAYQKDSNREIYQTVRINEAFAKEILQIFPKYREEFGITRSRPWVVGSLEEEGEILDFVKLPPMAQNDARNTGPFGKLA